MLSRKGHCGNSAKYIAGAYEPRHKLAARIGISPITLADLLAGNC
jgi:hypothetical protein